MTFLFPTPGEFPWTKDLFYLKKWPLRKEIQYIFVGSPTMEDLPYMSFIYGLHVGKNSICGAFGNDV